MGARQYLRRDADGKRDSGGGSRLHGLVYASLGIVPVL
ncbi:hypothetical protein [Achromobacter phage ewik_TL4]|nr:hypothetical protein [Achromobacter phage ewik_TL4]